MLPTASPEPADPIERSLLFNVAALLREPIGTERRFRVQAPRYVLNDHPTPVTGNVRLLRTDRSVLAHAALRLASEELCGACLAAFAAWLDVVFDEEFWPPTDPLTGEPLTPPEEREGFPIVAAHIDLTEALRQYAEMARPLSPRCSPDCPGLDAPPAGSEAIDSRWAALQRLRSQIDRAAGGAAPAPGPRPT